MSLKRRSLSYPKEQLKPFFSWGIIISLGRRSLRYPMEQFKPLLIWEHGCSPRSDLRFFSPREHDCSPWQFKSPLSWKHSFFRKNCSWSITLKICLKEIYFHPFCSWMKKNSRKNSNPRPSGCKGDSNNYISMVLTYWKGSNFHSKK